MAKSADAEWARVLKFQQEAAKIIVYLYERWQDEKQYENIDTYLQPLKQTAKKCGVILRVMTKRPFGVEVKAGRCIGHVTLRARPGNRLQFTTKEL